MTNYIEGMFGAEDYKLVACVPTEFLSQIDDYDIIGKVVDFDGTYLQIDKNKFSKYEELNLFDHFNS